MAIYRIRIEKLDDNRDVLVQSQAELIEEDIQHMRLSEEEILKRYFEHMYKRFKQQEAIGQI
jgi:predicted small metal-binding protein